jgi:hypothetical protein
MRLDGPADLCSVNHPLTIRVSCRVVMALVGDSHPALPWLEHPHESHVMCTGIGIFRLTMISSRHVLVHEFLPDQVSKKGFSTAKTPRCGSTCRSSLLNPLPLSHFHSPASSALALQTLFHVPGSLPFSYKSPKTRRNARRFQAAGELAYAHHRRRSACRLTRSTTWSNTMDSIRSDIWVKMADEGQRISARGLA